VATATLGPVVRLVEHQEGGPAAFDRGRVAGDQLHPLAAVVGAPELLAWLDAVLLLHLLRDEAGEESRGVLGLLLGDCGDLDPGVRVGGGYGVAVLVEVGEAAGADELDQAEHREHRVLAPALAALKDAGAVDEAAGLVDGVPPEDERKSTRLTPVT